MNWLKIIITSVVVVAKFSDLCNKHSDTFSLKGKFYFKIDIPNINFCYEQKQSNYEESLSTTKLKATQYEIEQQINQNPFSYSAIDVALYINPNELHITGHLVDHAQNSSTTPDNRLRISKDIHLKNILSRDMVITNIYSSSKDFKIEYEKIVMPPQKRIRAFTAIFEKPLSDIPLGSYEVYFAIEIAYQIKVPVRLLVYDKQLMCQIGASAPGLCAGPTQRLDFGNIGIYEQVSQEITLFNPNPIKIDVYHRQIDVKSNPIRMILNDKQEIKSASKRRFSFEIKPFKFIKLRIILNTNQYDSKGMKKITFRTAYEFVDINCYYNVIQGSVQFYPSTLSFDPYLNSQQNVDLYARSTFNVPIQLLQIDNKQLKNHNFSLLTLATIIPQKNATDILKIEYTSKSRMRNLLVHKLVMRISTDVIQSYEIPIVFKASNISVLPLKQQQIKKDHQSQFQSKQQDLSINYFIIVASLTNILYIILQLKQKTPIKENTKFKIQILNMSFKNLANECNLMQIFAYEQQIQQQQQQQSYSQSQSQSSEQQYQQQQLEVSYEELSDKMSLQGDQVQETQQTRNSIEESSSTFSQGESVVIENISELTDINYQQNHVGEQQKNDQFDLFQKVQFSVSTEQQQQSKWNFKDPIFLPNDSEEEEAPQERTHKLEQLQYQYQNKLPRFRESELKFPFSWQSNPYLPKQVMPIFLEDFAYPSKPPGI